MQLSGIILPGLALLTIFSDSFSQIVIRPNYALKSHETLEIRKIETNDSSTIFYMTVENRREGGTFCADKNIFIQYPDGARSKILYSKGIPVCPGTYKFNSSGEKLDFTMTFPPLKSGTGWIDLIEDCNDNCFSFYGVTLDIDLNRKIDEAFALVDRDKKTEAIASFITLEEETGKSNPGIEGLIFVTIIKLAIETGDTVKASEWYNKLKDSGAPHLTQELKYLNDQGIRF